MKISCIGGGPAGLYLSILLKKADPNHKITVYERNPKGSTFGWGIVFSDGTLDKLAIADRETAQEINDSLNHWDDIEVHFKGEVIKSTGHGFCGVGRAKLLDILERRAISLGVEIIYGADVDAEGKECVGSDLIIACDGIFSQTRSKYTDSFLPDLQTRLCRFTWLGTHKLFKAFTFIFKETEFGWFQAHCYRFSPELSTFIVETREDTWDAAGLNKLSKEDSIAFCEKLFADHLDGNKLMSNAQHLRGSAAWINFIRVVNKSWYHKNVVLLGDACATAHFSIGSGTRLAFEGAIALADSIKQGGTIPQIVQRYQKTHEIEVIKLQNAARNSTEWFESVNLKANLKPEQFAYSLLTRSQRVSHENLRLRDKSYLSSLERFFELEATEIEPQKIRHPMFVPYQLRSLKLKNRIAVSPMAMYSAQDGLIGDFHLVHLGARALGGAGLVFTEMTATSPEARITPGCAGIYNDLHVKAWQRVVDFVHASGAKIAIQLGHSGRKGSTQVGWQEMDAPLPSGNWEILAPSPIKYRKDSAVPKEMTRDDMSKVCADFVNSAKAANAAGFDLLELHMAHGYLLSTFLSPLTNVRKDNYGGSLENRLRFPLEIFEEVRKVWPLDKPISVRISATDWHPGGNTIDESILIARAFAECGVDIMDISSGQVTVEQKPTYGRMFQVPFSERIRLEVGIPTMTVGNIYEPDHVNSILASGRADLVLLARPHLSNPNWTLDAAAKLGYNDIIWPKQYLSGKSQYENIVSKRS